jgi:hypothetical protein
MFIGIVMQERGVDIEGQFVLESGRGDAMSHSWFNYTRGFCAFVAVVLLIGLPTANGEMILSSQELASLSGFVYCDINNNGILDSVEVGIGNVNVLLEGSQEGGDAVKLVVTTKSNGEFSFDDLFPGLYSLTETQPIKYVQGKPNAVGSAGGVADGSDSFKSINLLAGIQGASYNFGEWGLKTQYLSKRQLIVPEPTTVSVLVAGLLALVGFRRFRR